MRPELTPAAKRSGTPGALGALISYIVRLVGYALVLGIPGRISEYLWERAALDGVDVLRAPHDAAMTIVIVTPFVLALFGYGVFRRPAVFIAMYLAGAALTAPFALARLALAGP
jgi:hypothetical protein